MKRAGANMFLTADEAEWLSKHGAIRVGYQDDYLAFCAADEGTGQLTGALKDVLDSASEGLANAHIDFEAIAYPSASAALDALHAGEVDCIFPSNLDGNDGERYGVVMTPVLTSTDVYALVRQADQRAFVNKEHIVVAVNEGNPNYDAYLRDHFPEWNKIYFPTTEDCLKAVADNVADCVLIGSYRYSNLTRLCEKYHLANLTLGEDVDYSFAVGSGEMLEQRLLSDLRQRLDGYQFEVHLQPKFDIQSEPPRFVGAEALVRWHHPELRMVGPDDFIPLFEKSGQIGLLDKFVWEEAARLIARWRELCGVTIPVSVNLSRVDVFDPELEKTLDEILRRNDLGTDTFRLEVTESAYTENAERLVKVVESLRGHGYEVGMDDFGTGYSSLSMLSVMPVDVLKMDREFIRDIEHDERGVQLVALIIGIAENLGIPVIAEGVETDKQLELLKGLGCAMVQGYYFSRPIPAPDFEAEFVQGMQVER